jgi:hypothetical protein
MLRFAGDGDYDYDILALGYLSSGRELPSYATCRQSSSSEA